uniref:SKP1-like protein 21 n=1 Tax=Kalanchoe fedtschenkoi TaxID=63787 RepID=A0A7N0UVS1_KALFE
MSKLDLAVIKPEIMRSYIWLKTSDGSIQQVEQVVAMFCPVICQDVIEKGLGSSKTCPVCLPQKVNPAMLSLILDYCRFHQAPGRSNKERKTQDEKFIKMETNKLCELASAADSLQLKPLVDLTSRALARVIEGKSPEEIRDIFHLPDDLTEEEKLEPLKNITDDPRIRLLNRLYEKKRKELKERNRPKKTDDEVKHEDRRSVDDLLSFINGGNSDSEGVKVSKNKKKNKRKKEVLKKSPMQDVIKIHEEDQNLIAAGGSVEGDHPYAPNFNEIISPLNFEDDGEMDDEIDPEFEKEIDREVEDFKRILNSGWPERMQEMLTLGKDKRPVTVSINGGGTLRRYTGVSGS